MIRFCCLSSKALEKSRGALPGLLSVGKALLILVGILCCVHTVLQYALVYLPTNLYSVFSLLDVWNKRDYYKILGLSPNADQKDVKKAYFQACHLTDTRISYMVTQTVYIKTFEGEVLVSCYESKVNL